MQKAPPYHHAGLRAALIDEMLAALGAGAGDTLTMRQLAARVGVSHTAAYAHFADKSALLAAVAAVGFERLHVAVRDAAGAASSPATALADAALAYLAFAREQPALYDVMFAPGSAPPPPAGDEATAFAVLVRTVAALPVAGDPRTAGRVSNDALTVWSLVHGIARFERGKNFGPLDPPAFERLARHAVAALVRGLEAA